MIIGAFTETDDEFHQPSDDTDHEWAETSWFTFAVPELRLSGQLYAYFKPTLGTVAAAAYVWDDSGDQIWDCRYAKNFWHLPLPHEPLSNLHLGNGARYAVLEPGSRYALGYDDPDGDDIHLDLSFTGIAPPHLLGDHHIDQPGHIVGEIELSGESIPVDGFGFRDRTWGRRSQVGVGLNETPCKSGGYSFATVSADDAFFAITLDFGECSAVVVHGYLIQDGIWAKLVSGERIVERRDCETGAPTGVRLHAVDEFGRTLDASGAPLNRLGFAVNPNLWTWISLTEWTWNTISAYGEDHDNWSTAGQREFSRRFRADRRSSGLRENA